MVAPQYSPMRPRVREISLQIPLGAHLVGAPERVCVEAPLLGVPAKSFLIGAPLLGAPAKSFVLGAPLGAP